MDGGSGAAAGEHAPDAQPLNEVAPEGGDAADAVEGRVAESTNTENVADEDAETMLPEQPPELVGAWQQLQGVPRPAGSGPRFLAWDDRGHAAAFPGQKRLEVRYAAGAEGPQRVADHAGLSMAALSAEACCFAAGAGAKDGSQLLIRPAERWEKAVFSAPLGGAGEAVEAVACGCNFAAALTSRRLLRVYGLSGLPLSVVSAAGRSVALAARGPLLLAVTGAAGSGEPQEGQDDALEFRLLDVHARAQRSAGRLPLSCGARLRWLGLSEDYLPVAIDSAGVVRVLFGMGPGSWGPANGGGGEWVPVLDLSEEEARAGPLWAVSVRSGVCLFAETGGREPLPATSEGDDPLPEGGMAEPLFGHGAALRELRWRLPLGPLAAGSAAVEEVLREELLARHVRELEALGVRPADEAAASAWKQRALKLFGLFVKAGEVERALDVCRTFFTAGGCSKLLSFAQDFAEKAGCHRLADQVAALPRLAASAPADAPAAPAPPPAHVPKVMQQELPPLFEPGELEGGREGKQVGQRAEEPAAARPAPPEPAEPEAAPAAAEEPTPGGRAGRSGGPLESPADAAQEGGGSPSASPAAAAPAPAPAPAASANPFARRKAGAPAAARAPHLLRDALGGAPPLKVARTAA